VRAAVRFAESIADFYKKDLVRPEIYVHKIVKALREHACVASGALSYYDGAIHVAVPEGALDAYARKLGEIQTSVRHEYAHHLLTELGVALPVWLHEGFAQRFAGETVSSQPSSKFALNQVMMAGPLSTASTDEDVAAFYEQASDMLEFLNQLPSLTGPRGYPTLLEELTQALAKGVTDAEGLFVWATIERGRNIFTGDAVKVWQEYLEGGGFANDTLAAIAEERNARRRPESP
jgi:hypothetical protein